MPEAWTGELVGKMHNEHVTYDDLANMLGVGKSYISMVLNGSRNPKDAKERFEKAFVDCVAQRSSAEH